MTAEELKTLQEPLKKKYQADPGSAIVTLKARARPGEGITCKVETGRAIVEAGLHPATGGDGLSLCSGDMLLEALAACAGVTLKAVATAIQFNLEDAEIRVEGDIDFRGTLSVDRTAPVGFKEIRLHFALVTPEPEDRVAGLLKLTERYCVVYQTLRSANTIRLSHGA